MSTYHPLVKKMSNKNISFTQSIPTSLHKELQDLVAEYSVTQINALNGLNVQDLVRLIIKSHMQRLRGPSLEEMSRVQGFSKIPYKIGECPQCALRVDKQDFPVLIEREDGLYQCQVCGYYSNIEEV